MVTSHTLFEIQLPSPIYCSTHFLINAILIAQIQCNLHYSAGITKIIKKTNLSQDNEVTGSPLRQTQNQVGPK